LSLEIEVAVGDPNRTVRS